VRRARPHPCHPSRRLTADPCAAEILEDQGIIPPGDRKPEPQPKASGSGYGSGAKRAHAHDDETEDDDDDGDDGDDDEDGDDENAAGPSRKRPALVRPASVLA
jgi:hypothetical protein